MNWNLTVSLDEKSLKAIEALASALKTKVEVKEPQRDLPLQEEVVATETEATEPVKKDKKEPKKKKITIEMVRTALNNKAKQDGFDKALEIVKDMGANNVTELKEEYYEKVLEICKQ